MDIYTSGNLGIKMKLFLRLLMVMIVMPVMVSGAMAQGKTVLQAKTVSDKIVSPFAINRHKKETPRNVLGVVKFIILSKAGLDRIKYLSQQQFHNDHSHGTWRFKASGKESSVSASPEE